MVGVLWDGVGRTATETEILTVSHAFLTHFSRFSSALHPTPKRHVTYHGQLTYIYSAHAYRIGC